MSRTGARPWRAPVSSIRRRIVVGHRLDELGIEASPPRRSTAGSTGRRGPAGRGGVSSWMMAGIPSRVSSTQVALDLVAGRGDLDGSQVRRAGEPGDLADPVARQRGQRGSGSSLGPRTISNDQTDPSWATFSAQGHPGEQVGDARASIGSVGVAVAARRSSSSALHRPAGQAATIWRSANGVEDDRRHHRQRREGQDRAPCPACTAVEKFMTPSGRVHWSAPLRTSSGSRNAFQLVTIGEDADGGEGRPRERQQDPPEEPERAAAVDRARRPRARPGCAGRTAAG